MSVQNNKNQLKKLFSRIGVASAGAIFALPVLGIMDFSSNKQVLAQTAPGYIQQNPAGTSRTQQTLGNPVPQPYTPPVSAGTTQQFLGNPYSQPPTPPAGTRTNQQYLGNPYSQPRTSPRRTNRFQPGSFLPQVPNGNSTTQRGN